MIEVFAPRPEDMGLARTLIREANILLASREGQDDYDWHANRLADCIDVVRRIEKTDPQNDADIDFIVHTVYKIWHKGILAPLTLNDDEFSIAQGDARRNARCYDICKKDGKICNCNAYKGIVRAAYVHDLGRKTRVSIKEVNYNPVLYVAKGGVVTGEYVKDCIIRPEIVGKHSFTIQSVVGIPVSLIYKGNANYCIVDHREPKLKVLKEFYDIPVYFDENVKSYKMNIRNYKKD